MESAEGCQNAAHGLKLEALVADLSGTFASFARPATGAAKAVETEMGIKLWVNARRNPIAATAADLVLHPERLAHLESYTLAQSLSTWCYMTSQNK